jgi:hypothetical protein
VDLLLQLIQTLNEGYDRRLEFSKVGQCLVTM